MNAELSEISLNRRIQGWKEEAKAAQRREQVAVDALAKSEAALRNMDRERAREKARADRAEATLRSVGIRGAA